MKIKRHGFIVLRIKHANELLVGEARRIDELAKMAQATETSFRDRLIRYDAYREIVQICLNQKARWYHLFWINEIMQETELLKPTGEPKTNESGSLENFIAWIGARIGLSEMQVLTGYTSKGIRQASIEYLKSEIEKHMAAARTKIDPGGHIKALNQNYNDLKDDMRSVHRPGARKSFNAFSMLEKAQVRV